MHPFRKLSVWRRAHSLALAVHEVSEWRSRVRYVSLIDQMCRASASIPANIVEASAQVTAPQFARYLTIAFASAKELEYHILLARDLGVIAVADYTRLEARIDQVCGMLVVLRKRILEDGGRQTPDGRRRTGDKRTADGGRRNEDVPQAH